MNIYLFNPDSDLALADGGANYIPPASVRQMACDLALLPVWYASPGDGVLAPSAYNDAFLGRMSDLFSLQVRLVTEPELGEVDAASVRPWGWNLSVRQRLCRSGLPEKALSNMEAVKCLRRLASREQVAGALEAFRHLPFCRGESHNLRTLEACRAYVQSQGRTVLKAPWSGSGKGLFWCPSPAYAEVVSGWCARVLRTQGCVVASPIYNKVADFALEFQADGQGGVSFLGYSLFETNARGAYQGNLLLPEAKIEDRLASWVGRASLRQVREAAQAMLARTFAGYAGIVGIDMMIVREEEPGAYAIHPCVEVNLRMNMGVVALNLVRKLLAPGAEGRFVVEHYPSAAELCARNARDRADAPPVVNDGRLVSGYLPLVPVTPTACYRAFVRVTSPA